MMGVGGGGQHFPIHKAPSIGRLVRARNALRLQSVKIVARPILRIATPTTALAHRPRPPVEWSKSVDQTLERPNCGRFALAIVCPSFRLGIAHSASTRDSTSTVPRRFVGAFGSRSRHLSGRSSNRKCVRGALAFKTSPTSHMFVISLADT